jgi:hypothetical protein
MGAGAPAAWDVAALWRSAGIVAATMNADIVTNIGVPPPQR